MNEGLPLVLLPIHVLETVLRGTRLATEKHHDGIGFSRDESENKDIFNPAGVTLEDGLSEGSIFVQGDLLVLGAHQMIHDVGSGGVAAAVAKPPLADVALNHAVGIVNAAIFARVLMTAAAAQKSGVVVMVSAAAAQNIKIFVLVFKLEQLIRFRLLLLLLLRPGGGSDHAQTSSSIT